MSTLSSAVGGGAIGIAIAIGTEPAATGCLAAFLAVFFPDRFWRRADFAGPAAASVGEIQPAGLRLSGS